MSDIRTLIQIFDRMPIGVVLMNARSEVVFFNRYEEELADRKRQNVVGQPFFSSVAPCTETSGLGPYFFDTIGHAELRREIMFQFPRPYVDRPRDVRLVLSSMTHDDVPYGLLLVEDVSAIRAVEHTKDFLVRMLAHDMRNPMTAVSFALDLLETAESDVQLADMIETSRESLHRLSEMVRNLHEITRLHSGEVPLRCVETNAGKLASEAVEICGAAARRNDVELKLVEPLEPVTAVIDAELVRRALVNLLDNGLRHTPAGGKVTVRCRVVDDQVRFEVRDNGPGVHDEIRRTLFQPFVRGPEDTAIKQDDHHGLGLAFVHLVAREHGGEATLNTPGSGGAEFVICFPLSQRLTTRSVD